MKAQSHNRTGVLRTRPGRGKRVGELQFEPALFVDGQWHATARLGTFKVEDPSTHDVLAELPCAGASETQAAIEAAGRAFELWKRTSVLERADLLLKLERHIAKYREPLAELTVLEQGMPLPAARGSIDYAMSFFRWFAEEARRIYGETISHPDPSRKLVVDYFPRGVVGVITPWNGPLSMPAKKVAAALAAGCTIVMKPAELTPLSALALTGLANEAGFPPGAINVVCGDVGQIGRTLLRHPDVRTISFTGSLRTGRYLYTRAARQIKHVVLELGGNAPFIVFADADLSRAADDLVALKKANGGQVCVTANRVFVDEYVLDEFQSLLLDRYGNLPVGDGFNAGIEQGPLITSNAAERVDELVRDALATGASALCGGQRSPLGANYYPPTILKSAAPTSRIATEEIFGPVISLTPFKTEAEVVAAANATPNRLAAYAYTTNLGRGWRMAQELEFGVVGINDPRPITCEAPFGGNCLAGIGREGGRSGLLDYLDSRLIGFRD
jgi:succinate-semialdehyde dehydrogenase/glutarate-semialdehyde dehydrogenase